MEMYPWVSEGSSRKYFRAIETLRKAGKEVTEAAVKELYLRDGGLIEDDPSTYRGVSATVPPAGASAPLDEEGNKGFFANIAEKLGINVAGLKKQEIIDAIQAFEAPKEGE